MDNNASRPAPEFGLITKAKDLVKHTDMMTSEKRYPKKYRFTLVNRLQEKTLDIFECIAEANELNLNDPAESRERLRLERRALTVCKTVLFLIEVSFEKSLISNDQCAAWVKTVMDVKNMTANWYKKDRERAVQK
ncbi:hypothetical protein FACS1894208_07200 [Clostridia bacterium]|nr:hypothetical protein FACS1894208_07200 [Clostridia bacterium]